jgi:soluble lytic murein transglycosylase
LKLFRKKRLYALLLVIVIGVLFVRSGWIGQLLYPVKYEKEIVSIAGEHQVDPFLIAAIIRVESNFQSGLVSSKNAQGLMQIMPETAAWIIEQTGLPEVTQQFMMDEEVNIYLGAWYVKSLQNQFRHLLENKPVKDRLAVISAAYNAGPGTVRRWVEEGIWDGTYGQTSSIPYGETRHYIHRVVYYYHKYEEVYAKKWREG